MPQSRRARARPGQEREIRGDREGRLDHSPLPALLGKVEMPKTRPGDAAAHFTIVPAGCNVGMPAIGKLWCRTKTHRGLRGRVEKGKSGGGLCYGYDVVKHTDTEGEPIRGERTRPRS